MDNIRDEISKEISICDAEIRKAREEIIRLTESARFCLMTEKQCYNGCSRHWTEKIRRTRNE